MKYLPRVLPYLRPYRKLAIISILVTILTAAASLLAPWPLKLLVDNVLGRQPLPAYARNTLSLLALDRVHLLIIVILAGLGITVVSSALNVAGNYVNTTIEQRIVLDFRCDLFKHAQRLGVAYHDRRSHGLLMYGINFEADAAGGLIMALQPLAQSALTLVGMFVISFQIDRELALLSLTVLPFLYYSIGYYATHIQNRLQKVKLLEAGSLSVIHEAMSLVRVIVAFGRQSHEDRRFRTQGNRAVASRVGVTVRQTGFSLGVNLITATGTALVLGVGAYHTLEGKLTVGQLLIVMSYIGAVYQPLEAISYTIGGLQDRFVALGMAFSVLDTRPEVEDRPDAIDVETVQGQVTFEEVSFSYLDRVDTLKDISFQVQSGQVVAIVGPTGAGKTTLMNLIPRFYDPQKGRILLDGHDLRAVRHESLIQYISLVPQEPMLFSGTIAENIRYGRLEATMNQVVAAATNANAHDFIERLPKGYETEVGERGAQLSGGERQRICVARAFLKDAPVLILDEPTSAIDSRTESIILDALDRLMVGRTTFMIAHRLSTIRHADLILVMDRGQLAEYGTHEELLAREGLYKQLHEVQTSTARRKLRLTTASADLLGEETGTPKAEERSQDMEDTPTLACYACNPPRSWSAGEAHTYAVTLTNVGVRTWNAGGANPVQLGVHFGTASDVVEDGWLTDQRFPLPADIEPGSTITVLVTVQAPEREGTWILRHRMVEEGIAWCDQMERAEVAVTATQPEANGWAEMPALAAGYECCPPVHWGLGETRSYDVTMTNLGRHTWHANGANPVLLGVHFGDDSNGIEEGWATDQRFPLSSDVAPGESVTLRVNVTGPSASGAYVLRHRMVKEQVAWFEQIEKAAVAVEGTGLFPKRKIVLFGMMTKFPVPGVIWQTVQYMVGLARLGYDVYYVEAHQGAPLSFITHEDDDGSCQAASFIAGIMDRFDLHGHWAYHALHADGSVYGMSEHELRGLYRSADLLINLHGGTLPRPEHYATGRLVYLETDPVRTQIELHNNVQDTIDFLGLHCAFFTFAENYGNPDCKLPVSDLVPFQATRQPIVLDFWQGRGKTGIAYTTIASWRQLGREVTFAGDVYHWSKHYEFEKFIDVPRRTGKHFELALNRHQDGEALLRSTGWAVRDALLFGSDIDTYRDYIAGSRGEFSVAKDQNVRLRSGWFSDRSATYLAAGKPVITQETGFSNVFPTGEGLFAFTTTEEIEEAIARIESSYPRQCRAASELAQEYFSHEVVLGALLREVGLSAHAPSRVTAGFGAGTRAAG